MQGFVMVPLTEIRSNSIFCRTSISISQCAPGFSNSNQKVHELFHFYDTVVHITVPNQLKKTSVIGLSKFNIVNMAGKCHKPGAQAQGGEKRQMPYQYSRILFFCPTNIWDLSTPLHVRSWLADIDEAFGNLGRA